MPTPLQHPVVPPPEPAERGATASATGPRAAVHVELIHALPDLVTRLGGDVAALLARVGIDPARLDRAPGPAYRQMIELMELAARVLDCPDFGLRLAVDQNDWRAFGPLGLVMRNSPTLGDALDYVSTHIYAHSPAARVWIKRLPRDHAVFVGHDVLLDRVRARGQSIEHSILLGHLVARQLTGGYARIRRAHFRHQPAMPLKAYRRYFGCEVMFGQNEDGVFFLDRDLARPIVDPDRDALRAASARVEADDPREQAALSLQVRGIVLRLLGTGRCTNARVAADLAVHARTLHRRLQAEGTSFQQIKDEVRQEVMLHYLQQTDLDLAWISEKLGFAEQSVMTRRCNQWLSASPSRIRERARDAATSG